MLRGQTRKPTVAGRQPFITDESSVPSLVGYGSVLAGHAKQSWTSRIAHGHLKANFLLDPHSVRAAFGQVCSGSCIFLKFL